MGTRFTRVTIVGTSAQLDVSLPADAPIASQMPTVLQLLSVPSSPVPVRWRLSSPALGALPPDRALDELGVLDGATLHLVEADAAPPPPFVDDVERAVADVVAARTPAWAGAARRSAVGWLLALLLFAMTLLGFTSVAPLAWLGPVLALLGALVAGARLRSTGGAAAAAIAVPAAAALVFGVATTIPSLTGGGDPTPLELLPESTGWQGFPLITLLAAVLGGLLMALVRRSSAGMIATSSVVVAGVLALLCNRLGMPDERTAALGIVLAVLLSGVAGQLALGGAGVVNLMVADEAGRRIPRIQVQQAVQRGTQVATGAVTGAAAIGAGSCWVLAGGYPGAGWIAPALCALGGLVLGLRARMFSRAVQVGPMLAVPLVAAAALAWQLPTWWSGPSAGPLALAALVLVAGLLAWTGLRTLPDVAGARVARLLERVELLAVLALIPGVVLLFEVIPVVQRWV